MTVYSWPPELAARGVAFNQRGMTVGGPPTLSGEGQVGSLDAGYWVATLDLVTLDSGTMVKAFRALRAKMQGGAHQLKVPVFDEGQVPYVKPGGAAANAYPEQRYSDNKFHTDGHGFYRPAISVTLAADAALRATSVSVTVTRAGPISGGEYFSLGDRLHVIESVLSVAGGTQVWSIWPPTRAAAPSGTRVNLEAPVCRMRLATETEMDLALGRLWRAQPSIAFIEERRGS
jgi:hypothetical protein